MKLRQIPEDFIVDEIPAFTPDPAGRYFVYELTKRSLATLEVLDILRKALRVSGRELSASGLKDKHAIATQLVSLPKPLPGTFHHALFSLRFVGKSVAPLLATNVAGNRFAITLRALSEAEAAALGPNAEALKRYGVANYYDSQRFGGGSTREDLPGRAIILREYERALRLHLATPRRKQNLKDKRIRRECAKHWGDWTLLAKKLPRCRERSIIAYLDAHPGDWRGALDRVDLKVTTLYLAAYQSYLFNQSLRELAAASVASEHLYPVAFKGGILPFWLALDDSELAALRGVELPLLAHSSEMESFAPAARAAVERALAGEEIALADLVVKGFDRLRLRPARRRALLMPDPFELSVPEPDDLNPGRLKAIARFALPRGAYATVIVKRLALLPR